MFYNPDLLNHLQTSNTVEVRPLIVAEWNQNTYENIDNYGNYKWNYSSSVALTSQYDSNDAANNYLDGLESTTISEYRAESGEPLTFINSEDERRLYYPLKDCFNQFRPRSGINKILFFPGEYVDSIRTSGRPRYYFCSRKDAFKYWTSYREVNSVKTGISYKTTGNQQDSGFYINDTNPFVVYKNLTPTNRVVVKMQTNLANPDSTNLNGTTVVSPTIRVGGNTRVTDPFLNRDKSKIPSVWKIQYLDENNLWKDAISFNESSTRLDSTNIVDWHGHVEIAYGLKIPNQFRSNFKLQKKIYSSELLPELANPGDAYLVGADSENTGGLYIWNNNEWTQYAAEYGFYLVESNDPQKTNLVTKLSDPDFFISGTEKIYREFILIKGLRICVEKMIGKDRTFDLIELSPRLRADMTNYATDYSIIKDIAATDYGLPVGGLAATTGGINLSNFDSSFTENNIFNPQTGQGSIIHKNLEPQIKFEFYESILNVDGYNYYVPLKTLYSENAAGSDGGMTDVKLNLRDLFFLFESNPAAPMLIRNCRLTKAVALLLDNIGFSNYVFKSINNANDPIIPYFFIEPNASVAEILQRIAQATQAAMFFDEYNNFVIMPKEYLLPDSDISDNAYSISSRLVTLYGQKVIDKVPNIESISGVDTKMVNDGQIDYNIRHIQRDVSSYKQAGEIYEPNRTYGYVPVRLWSLGNDNASRSLNAIDTQSSGYYLGAAPLDVDLSDVVPFVQNRQIQNNIIDIKDNARYITRFEGYVYANGEIIRYDAQEFVVSNVLNKVWINDSVDYQRYVSKLPFNGKIYPTGRLRIYAEPFYETVSGSVVYVNGAVRAHGRGQFGTKIASHKAGLDSYWTNISNRRAFRMSSDYLFNTTPVEKIEYPTSASIAPVATTAIGSDSNALAGSEILGKVANFIDKNIRSEYNYLNPSKNATVQTSSLVFSGIKNAFLPDQYFYSSKSQRDIVTYVYKTLNADYKHFGTRMRILGKQSNDSQVTMGQTGLYVASTNASGEVLEVGGSSGGIGVMVNPNTNAGYYFEIAALSDDVKNFYSASSSSGSASIIPHDVIFYKILDRDVTSASVSTYNGVTQKNIALPVKLWGTNATVLADNSVYLGIDRYISSSNLSNDYDLGVEWEKINNNTYKFYLYINNVLVATVVDTAPLTSLSTYPNFTTCLFVRAGSTCMFDNIYALKNKANQKDAVTVSASTGVFDQSSIFSTIDSNNNISVSESLRKYAMSGLVQSNYLSSIGTNKPPGYDLYFDEFGTILRECVYLNIKYNQAYPALTAKLAKSVSSEKSYVVGGFFPGAYGAEMMLFNTSDGAIDIGDNSANAITITGLTFTQNIAHSLNVDDYFKEISNLSDPVKENSLIISPTVSQKVYNDIRNSRSIYGLKSFNINSPYIQDTDTAKSLMKWIINKTLKPRMVVEVDSFATPHIQLGDIVKINYDLPEGVKFVDINKRFIVSSINYERSSDSILNQIRLIEV